MIYILYLMIAFIATTVGALTGMGGGVIIKPVLDALGDLNASDIGILSSVTVFIMALVSVGKQIRQKDMIDLKTTLPLAAGSLLGGSVGERILTVIIEILRVNRLVVAVQNICLALLIIAVFLYMGKGKDRKALGLHGTYPALSAGMMLGVVSSFLGIGGGPINVALIIFLFGCGIKTAAVYSIIIILFAQVSKLVLVLLFGTSFEYDLSMLPVMVIGAVLGGWTGSCLNKKLHERMVEKAFNGVQIVVFFICLFNVVRNLIP